MAGVLDALASYVTNMLTEMAKEEVAMLIGVSGEIDKLGVKLTDLKNFLADADRRNITDTSVQAWVEELKRAMYDVTDILDLCQLKVMEQGSPKDMKCCNPLLFCMRNPLHAHDIGTRINDLTKKLDGISERGGKFSFIKLQAYEERKTTQSLAPDRKTNSVMERSGAVGEKIEEDTRTLVEILTKEGRGDNIDHHMVVAIIGVGGIGKTTLAKKVFHDEATKGKFSKKIWLSITQEFNGVELLSSAVIAAGGDLPRGAAAQHQESLVVALMNAIKDKKFFLVLDDMWSVDGWDKLLMIPFSYGGSGSRVLVTTRYDIVGRSMKAMHCHHVDKLGAEDAWSLLKKQVLASQENEHNVDMLQDIGLQIIAKCDGLPLAVKVIGGLLCKKERTQRDWEDVLKNDIWSVSHMPEELNYAIYLSYEDLSPCLKQCFLHFSLKPKKTAFHDNEFVGMWIGEGFVHGDRLEKLGIEYHKELILRNLIEPTTSYLGQHVCNMHDVVRSFAQNVSRNEALVVHNGEIVSSSKLILQRFLRLSIETKGMESNGFEWKSLQEQKSLRSIIIIGKLKIQSSDSLITDSSLRTLHVECTNCAGLIESLYKLKHLRYLAVKGCTDITSLPMDIHKMKFLQHISLEGCENLVELPDSIVKLLELRFLDLDDTCVSSIPRGFRALEKLRTLNGFPAHMDGDWCSLEELGALSQLLSLNIVGLQNISAAPFATKARLTEKLDLSMLRLHCSSKLGDDGLVREIVPENDQRVIEEVFNELSPPPCIEDIRIGGYYGRQLPTWMISTSTMPVDSLRILELRDLACCTQLPDGLGGIPCLEYLSIFCAPAIKRVGPEFVQPHNHRHHASSSQTMATFPRLQEMVLNTMVEWEEWEWEEEMQAMPALEELFIQTCKLTCIPPGLSFHARSLKKLTLASVQGLHSLENFASIVELELHYNPVLTRISNFPKLQKLEINCCPELESLQEMSALRRLVMTVHYYKKQLPMYLQAVNPSHLLLDCSPKVLASMAVGKSGPEWVNFSHIQHVEAFADDGGIQKKWRLVYTREPYSIQTNIEPNLEELPEDEDFESLLSRLANMLLSSVGQEEDADNQDTIVEE